MRVSASPRLVPEAWTRRPGGTESSFSMARPGEMELSILMTLQFRRLRTGAVGGDARDARGGNWTWSGAWSAENGYARCGAGQDMTLGAGTVSQTIRGWCLDGEADECRPGQQASGKGGGLAVRRSPLLKQSCVVTLSGETARKACKSRTASRGNCCGTRPWWGREPSPQVGIGDRRRNADRGRRADVEGTSQSCGPGGVEQQGVLEMHLRRD